MRKASWVCVGVAATIVSCMSWTEGFTQPSFELGLKMGLGLAKLKGDNLETSASGVLDLGGGYTGVGVITSSIKDMNTGFVGGGYATMHLNPRFGIRLEALYSMKGAKGDNGGSIDIYDPFNTYIGTMSISGTNDLSLDYFELPILGVASFPTGPSSTFEVFAGPSFSFLTGAEIKETVTASFQGQSNTQSTTTDVSDSFAGTDMGGVLGVAMSFQVGAQVMFLEARWTAGFTEVDDTPSNEDWKNSAIGFSGGIGFPLGAKAK